MDYRDRIVINPEIRFGKPSVRGTRITVERNKASAKRLTRTSLYS
jgi:hypothetical protein